MTTFEILFIIFVIVFILGRVTDIYFGLKGLKHRVTEEDFNKALFAATDQANTLNTRLTKYQDEYQKLYNEYMKLVKLNKELTEKVETGSLQSDESTTTKKKPTQSRKKKTESTESGEKNS